MRIAMALPITGPINSSIETPSGVTYRTFRKERSVYRQKAPFTLPLPYTLREERVVSMCGLPHYQAVNSTGAVGQETVPLTRVNHYASYLSGDQQYATRTARSKFSDALAPDTAQLANLYLERKQSLNFLARRGTQLAAFFLLLKKDPLRAFSHVIPSHDEKKWKRTRQLVKTSKWQQFKKGSRSWSDLHLEVMFGLIPTYSDISGAVNVLAGGVPPVSIRERGSYGRTILTGSHPNGGLTGKWSLGTQVIHDVRCSTTVGATISVDNPNLWLANQLGLVNLGSVLWEATPWSFVVDYFFNVGDWLNQWTETWGLNVQQPFYTYYARDKMRLLILQTDGSGRQYTSSVGVSEAVYVQRFVGALPAVKLGIKKPWTLSARRASTSIALLLQRLPK